MNRSEWLLQKMRLTIERYDTLYAPIYDENWGGKPDSSHQQFIEKFLNHCPPGGLILDAACGTGRYWPAILGSGRSVFGIDQSGQMLLQAKAKHPDVGVMKLDMQEMTYQETFDGAICMDAMEFVFPEDWPLVLCNLQKAIKPNCPLYFTVEIADEADVDIAFKKGKELGLPVEYGEWAHEGGYHYYPRIDQVKEWISRTGFQLFEEAFGDEYQHFLVIKI
jgi:2-polyprenyl-3-methyl-5-hydroxy-6-metoxy-1,4-benzoquinol methylase